MVINIEFGVVGVGGFEIFFGGVIIVFFFKGLFLELIILKFLDIVILGFLVLFIVFFDEFIIFG